MRKTNLHGFVLVVHLHAQSAALPLAGHAVDAAHVVADVEVGDEGALEALAHVLMHAHDAGHDAQVFSAVH